MALRVVSGLDCDALKSTLIDGNISALCKIPGVGKKTAERLVMELRVKLGGDKTIPGKVSEPSSLEQVRSAMVNMGYKPKDVKRIMPSMSGKGTVRDQIVEGLSLLQGS